MKMKCIEPGCKEMVNVFTRPGLTSTDQRNCDRACLKHYEKYARIRDDNRAWVSRYNRLSE
jgi:hypothetical protein